VTARAVQDITIARAWNPDAPYAPAQLMLQALLAERFGMVARRDTREAAVYALVADAAAGRIMLRPAAGEFAPACGMQIGPGTLRARRLALSQLAEFLSQIAGRLVTDQTGLTGTFDVELRWTPDGQAGMSSDAPSLFTAVREQLGLRLDARRAPVPVLVIESLSRPTAD
jgi:uncharacterized protein (TIGR03435 family)